jgi:hypothetical protein
MENRMRWLPARLLQAFLLVSALGSCGPGHAETVLVPAGSVWKYLDDGSNQGTAWREPSFDDGAWGSGPAELGYGDGDEATVVGYGTDPSYKYVTTYFRHAFSAVDPSLFNFLRIRLLRDDAALVFLNGTEIARANLAAGTVYYTGFALTEVTGADEDRFFDFYADAALLVPGTNVLAVEVHQRSRTSSDISLDLELSGVVSAAHPMRKWPYLVYEGANTEMRVLWQLVWSDTCSIEWGTDQTYALGVTETHEYGSAHQHSHTIPALAPGEKYFYRVIANEDTCAGSFRAAPSDDAASVNFFAYGDSRTYPAAHDAVAAGIVQRYQAAPDFQTMVVSVGDLATNGDVDDRWQTELFDSLYPNICTMLAELPFQSCIGNHEMAGVLFSQLFPYPFAGGRYWSFDYGPAHFTCIDQYTAYGPGTPELAWIENDLATTTKPWRFVYLHEPGWSAGGGHENNTWVQAYLQPLFTAHDVTMVFAGHNHYYARAEVEGIDHVTTGGGGAPLYTPNPAYPDIVATARAYHYCTIEIDGGYLHFAAFGTDGAVLDSLTRIAPTGVEEGGDLAPRAEPALHAAFPNPFNPAVSIRFSLAEPARLLLAVHDAAGRRVATLADAPYDSGEFTLSWDGRDASGRPAPTGIYFVRMETGSFRAARKIVLLH